MFMNEGEGTDKHDKNTVFIAKECFPMLSSPDRPSTRPQDVKTSMKAEVLSKFQ